MNSDSEPNSKNISEPSVSYEVSADNKLHFYSSFEEMNNADLDEMAVSTALQRITNITCLIQNMYKDVLKEPESNNLYFDF